MTRLLHVTTSDISLDLLLLPQLRAFRDAGYEVHAASAPGASVPRIAAEGIVHHPLRHATRAMAPHRDLAALVELRRLVTRLRPAIVHTHTPKPGIYGRIAARSAGVPLVVNTQHGLYAQADDRARRRVPIHLLERLAAACSHAELFVNPEDLDTMARLGVPRRRLWFLGGGVDLERFRPRPELRDEARAELGLEPEDVAVGLVGRLVAEKGYAEVFEAARALRTSHPRLRWVVVGPTDPQKDDQLSAATIDRARADGVRFLGRRDDVERLYQAFDLFVLASYREGWPVSAMEASACGLPVVATDIRGCRQVVAHGETGVLVPARDASALAAAVGALAADAARRVALGRAGAARAVARFDQRRIFDLVLEVYAQEPR